MNKLLRVRESFILSSRMITTNTYFPSFLQVSTPLLAEPMKKKKKMDPQILKAREERKKKRIEKSIKKLEKNVKQLKPIEEIDLTINLQKEKLARQRAKIDEESLLNKRQDILKTWCTFKYQQHLLERKMIDRIWSSQSEALKQLAVISEELYIGAIQVDSLLLPFSAVGPTSTPPLHDYEVLDGEYFDETPKLK
uniref:Large ribosomal subunit protein mL40 n=1 Tax=Daphnia galeata TaxID=27404 RepID=A0A8J2W970_9CRUS|nr:unnamed protein product [Daphnia galeata]